MKDNKDPHLNILLDIQKQIGVLGSETARQSEMLVALNDKVAIANGRTTKNETSIKEHQTIIDNWKGRIGVIVVVGGFVINLVIDFLKNKLNI